MMSVSVPILMTQAHGIMKRFHQSRRNPTLALATILLVFTMVFPESTTGALQTAQTDPANTDPKPQEYALEDLVDLRHPVSVDQDPTVSPGLSATGDNGSIDISYSEVIADEPDESFVNDYVVTNTANSGEGSLVWAINQVNSNAQSRDRISFNIPGNGPHVILPSSMLPAIESPVVLDATTQPGYSQGTPVIVLDGSESSTNSVFALGVGGNAEGSIVRGLSIVGWDGDGIRVASENITIEGNFLGLLPDGTAKGKTGPDYICLAHQTILLGAARQPGAT